MKEILEELIKKGDRPMAMGLAALICAAHRESTSILWQYDEWNFDDIPEELINRCDELTEDSQLEIVSLIAQQKS